MVQDDELKKRVHLLSEQVEALITQNNDLSEELEQMRQVYVSSIDYSTTLENELERRIELLSNGQKDIPLTEDHEKDLRLHLSLEISKNEHLEKINKSLLEQLEQFRLLYVNISAHSTALENDLDEKYEEVKRLSITDPLTGTYNRSGFYKSMDTEIERTRRNHEPISLIMMDIDHFKTFNDNYGHEVGDHVLKKVVFHTVKSIRKSDIVCRWGGEEFLIIVPGLKLEGAFELAERIRMHIDEKLSEGGVIPVTCSFGVTEYLREDTIDSCIKKADVAMYEAKTSGRNQTCRSV